MQPWIPFVTGVGGLWVGGLMWCSHACVACLCGGAVFICVFVFVFISVFVFMCVGDFIGSR